MRKKKSFISVLVRRYAKRCIEKNEYKQKSIAKKAEVYQATHSLLWVWEFSKKAVLICFFFYVVVQIYSMAVMAIYADFTYLGELIGRTADILQNCVFAYLIKAGFENVGKMWLGSSSDSDEGASG